MTKSEAFRRGGSIASRHARRIAKGLFRFLFWSGGVIVFAILAGNVHANSEIAFDSAILSWLAERRTPSLNAAMKLLTEFGSARFLVLSSLIAVTILTLRRHWHSATYVAMVASGAGVLNALLKGMFARDRPELPIVTAGGFAFPSGHSMGAAAVYAAIAIVLITRFPRLRWPMLAICTTMVVVVGLTRAYLGVHYPSDIIAGWALGVTWALWLKPLVIGRGFAPKSIPRAELEADHFSKEELVSK